jgi:hypothetical protein
MVGLFGIRFGDYAFTEPEPVPVHGLPSILGAQAGLYVVLAFDPAAAPRPFRPLYFGESGDIRSRATGQHENHPAWCRSAGVGMPLYRAVCALPGWPLHQRRAAESALIRMYQPPCNERLSLALVGLGARH